MHQEVTTSCQAVAIARPSRAKTVVNVKSAAALWPSAVMSEVATTTEINRNGNPQSPSDLTRNQDEERSGATIANATCMYDNGGETDMIVQLQAAVLLGFWHSKNDDHTQPWYWTGIAINLCYIMGLHRDPDTGNFNPSVTDRRRSLWRRLWWSCFFRDRWLSLTLGRPLRISLNSCNTPLPSLTDLVCDLYDMPRAIANAYIPDDFTQLAEYWIVLMRLTKLLGDTLTLCYQPFGPSPTLQQVEALEAEFFRLGLPERCAEGQSRLATFSLYHLQLHYQASVITFYRPCMAKAPEGLPSSQLQAWQAEIRNKIDAAALQTNAILDNLVREKLLDFAEPMTPPLLVPAMHIHLLNCKAGDDLLRRLSLNKLDFCMLVMQEMQETYTCASVYRGIFLEAIRQLFPSYSVDAAETDVEAPGAPASPQRQDKSFMGTLLNDSFIDELMHESSLFNIWEYLPMMEGHWAEENA
ncbi:fungal specific transcription factor domain-containing protein [Aspergillus thermomutatus]|uniref:Xylanolytic transcriptional activator regulatory domain-containing protein n=1 Tax=Aspergillus thermomutatus TaxID=41047 RepID=A0A397HHE6_ASPTH|nr:uncharacterized protein CDV56_108974 [Aspergillus thermomutatus]RHZ62482.1 hypothetical protein CDV56_108974 [Aspergillus thermomutatus]